MAFLRFSVYAVIVLHAAILLTIFFSLHSEWSFLGMVNCQGGSSYLVDMDAVDDSGPSAFENDFSGIQDQDINECCKECQNDEGRCVPNCDACDVMEGAGFLRNFIQPLLGNAPWGRSGFLRNYGNHLPIPFRQPYHINRLARENYYPSTLLQNPNTMYPYRRCCADCSDGDIYCLSSCEQYQCKPTAVCASAGPGAYSSFCQRECLNDQMMGFSAMTMSFLPDRACRANCAKYVQQMCATNQCRDYGCVVYDCATRAMAICL